MEPVKAKELFKFFVNEGYDLGTEQNFFSALQNEEQRLKLFKFFTEDEGYNLGDYKNFTLKKKESSEPIVDQAPVASPSQSNQELISSESSEDPFSISEPLAPVDPTAGEAGGESDESSVAAENSAVAIEGDESDLDLTQQTQPVVRDQTKELYNKGDFFIEGSQEKNTVLEDVLGKNSVTDLIGDIYRAGKQGLVQGNTTDEASLLMLKGSDATSEDITAFLESQEELRALGTTDEMMNFNKIYDEADNKFLGFFEALGKNPSVFLQIGAQTITQLINPTSAAAAGSIIAGGATVGAGIGSFGGGVGAIPGAIAGAINPGVLKSAFAAASTVLETGLSFGEFIREEAEKKGLNFDEEGIRAVLDDDDAYNRSWKRSVARGATIGVIDRLAVGMGGRAIKSMRATRNIKKLPGLSKKRVAGTYLGVEAAGGGVGESLARVAAGQEQDMREIGFETIGGVGKAPISYVINTVTDPVTKPLKEAAIKALDKKANPPKYTLTDSEGKSIEVNEADVIDTIDNTDDVTFMGLNYKIENNIELNDKYNTRKMTIITGESIRVKLKEAGLTNETTINKIVALEIEKNKFLGNDTEAGKKRLKEIKLEIENLSVESTTTEAKVEGKKARMDSRPEIFGDFHTDKKLPTGKAEISDITSPDAKGVQTATYNNPKTGELDVIISSSGTNQNFVGFTRVYDGGKPTNKFTAKMESTGDAFKNMISNAEAALPPGAEVVETTTISLGGMNAYKKSKVLKPKTDSDGNVVTNPTKYSDATKETVSEKGESAFNAFESSDQAVIDAEVAKIKAANPDVEVRVVDKTSDGPKPPPLPPGVKPGAQKKNIIIDLPVYQKLATAKTDTKDGNLSIEKESTQLTEDELATQDSDSVKRETYETTDDNGDKVIVQVTTAKDGGRTVRYKDAEGTTYQTETFAKDNDITNEKIVELNVAEEGATITNTETIEGFENIANKKAVAKRKKELKTKQQSLNLTEKKELDVDAPIEGRDDEKTLRELASDILGKQFDLKTSQGNKKEQSNETDKSSLFKMKFSKKSLRKLFGKKGKLTDFVGARYIAKEGGLNIEDGVEINGKMLDQSEISDFIVDYPKQKDINEYFEVSSIDLNNLKVDFKDLTGLNPTKKNLNDISFKTKAKKKTPTQVAQQEVSEKEAGVKAKDSENVDIVNEIEENVLKNLNQGYKKGLKNIRNYLKGLKNDGAITTKQFGSILDKVVDENSFKNEKNKKETIDFIKKIFIDSDLRSEQRSLRKLAKKAAINLKRSIGRILKDNVSGKDFSLEQMLRNVVIIDPAAVPEAVYPLYKELIQQIGEGQFIVNEEADAASVAEKAKIIMEAMIIQDSRILELKSIYDNAQFGQIELFKNGKVDFKKRLQNLKENNFITDEDIKLMQEYKNEISPKEASKPKTKEELKKEKDKVIKEINELKIDKNRYDSDSPLSFPFLKTREDVRSLRKLIKDQDALNGLNNTDLKNLLKTLQTINNGYAPGIVSRLISKLQSVKDTKPLIQKVKDKKIKLPFIESFYAKLKTFSPFNKQSKIYNAIERGQIMNIDRLFGNWKTKEIFNSFFNDVAINQQQMEIANKQEQKLRDMARSLLESAYSKFSVVDFNKVAEADARMYFYRIQLEKDSNPLNKELRPALEWLDSTIEYLEANKLYDKQDAREVDVLKKIRKSYSSESKSTKTTLENIYDKFNKKEKEAIKILQRIDDANIGKAVYAATQRDAAFIPKKNYVHISVRPDSRKRVNIDQDVITDFLNSTEAARKPGTESKANISRDGKAKPIYTSAINASDRGSKMTNLDYFMTTPVRKSKQSLNYFKNTLIENYKGSPPVEVQALVDAIETAVDKTIDNVLINDFSQNDFMDMVTSTLQRLGYRTMLASVPRAGVEYLSNMSFALTHPTIYADGMSKKNNLTSEELMNIMQAINSKVITRLLGDNLMSSKVDFALLNKKSYKGERFVSEAKNKVLGFWDATGKKVKNGIALTADTLISSPDKLVMKPMFVGKLAQKFKEKSGKDIDWKKVAANDEAYMVENAEAIDYMRDAADEFVTLIGASDNPFMSRLQGKDAKGMEALWFNFNNFMTTFLKQEFDTAVIGVQAVAQRGDNSSLTRQEGAQLLAAVTLRMTAYSLGIKVAGELMLEMFNLGIEEEEEEKAFEQQIAQSLATTFSSLILGRNFGNAFKTIQNYNIEILNSEFGGSLRNGEYDQYKDAIQYNIIPLVNTGQSYKSGQGVDFGKLAPNFLGAYSPPVKTIAFGLKKLTEPDRKTPDARKRQKAEKNLRIPLEILGNTGFIPLYKDVRKVLLADIYESLRNAKKEETYNSEELDQLKKSNKRKYNKIIYDKKVQRYNKAYKKYLDYKKSPGKWRRANPNKKSPSRPNKPKKTR